MPNQRGAIQVNWGAAPSNGRPITKYEVEQPDGTITDVTTGTTVTLNGFPDDTAVQVKVRAVNLAGNGPDGTASARTIGAPSLTVTGSAPNYNAISVTFTPNNRGGASTCTLAVAGAGTASAACTTAPVTLTVGGLWPNNTYNYTVTITNPVGSDSANGTQASNQMRFTAICTPNLPQLLQQRHLGLPDAEPAGPGGERAAHAGRHGHRRSAGRPATPRSTHSRGARSGPTGGCGSRQQRHRLLPVGLVGPRRWRQPQHDPPVLTPGR